MVFKSICLCPYFLSYILFLLEKTLKLNLSYRQCLATFTPLRIHLNNFRQTRPFFTWNTVLLLDTRNNNQFNDQSLLKDTVSEKKDEFIESHLRKLNDLKFLSDWKNLTPEQKGRFPTDLIDLLDEAAGMKSMSLLLFISSSHHSLCL